MSISSLQLWWFYSITIAQARCAQLLSFDFSFILPFPLGILAGCHWELRSPGASQTKNVFHLSRARETKQKLSPWYILVIQNYADHYFRTASGIRMPVVALILGWLFIGALLNVISNPTWRSMGVLARPRFLPQKTVLVAILCPNFRGGDPGYPLVMSK